uniref:Uncharacterized protein n=1 Tax=Oryzias sinensis TaxID=183150 RepID=A0A8C7WWY3_9TELE
MARRDTPGLPDFSLLKRLARDQLVYLLEQVNPDFKTEGDLYQNVDMTSRLLWVDILCGPQDPQMKFQPESEAPIRVLSGFLGPKRVVNRRSLEGHRTNGTCHCFIGKYL